MAQTWMWQLAANAIALAGITVAVVIYLAQRQRKELSYEIISNTPLMSGKQDVPGDLQVLFRGQPVRNPALVTIRLTNTGNVPVIASDYEQPVSFAVGSHGNILTGDVIMTIPENLHAKANVEDGNVVVEPILLNKGDSLLLRILVSEFSRGIHVDGRVVGVKTVMNLGVGRHPTLYWLAWVLFVMGGSIPIALWVPDGWARGGALLGFFVVFIVLQAQWELSLERRRRN